MADIRTTEYLPDSVSPPGETLRELLEDRAISQAELASRMGRPRKTISEIASGKAAITPETAMQLALVTGVPADFWNARERAYRAYLASLEEARRLEDEYAFCRKFPLRAMKESGWIPDAKGRVELVRSVLSFFGVVSFSQWSEVYAQSQAAFRMSQAFAPDEYSLAAWMRRGILESMAIDTKPFDHEKFSETLKAVRALTCEPPATFMPELRDACAAAGVAVVFVPELPRSRASGATRWVSPERALIQLSLRYKTNDHLWFTFFHEAAHILLHGKKLIFVESTKTADSVEEEQANRWASDFLIPPATYLEFCMTELPSAQAVRSFAKSIGIAPGIVVGRLQHDERVPHSHLNDLKERYQWAPAEGSASD